MPGDYKGRQPVGWTGFGLAALLFPVTVLLHELAHLLVGRLFGFATVLHAASVTGLPEESPYGGAPAGVAMAALAGPAATLALAGLGVRFRHRAWGLPLVTVTLARFLINLLYMVQQGFVAAKIAAPSKASFDEVLAAEALGLPPQPLAALGAAVLVVGVIFLSRQAGPRGLLALTAGTVAGMTIWLGLLGPRLLP